LTQIVDDLNIPVMTFGLKNDFRNQLFEGSKYLLIYADKIEEMKTICWFCTKKAIMNLRVLDGKPVYEGQQVMIGGNESYYPVCRKHYFHPKLD
jgi:thymidine kinase